MATQVPIDRFHDVADDALVQLVLADGSELAFRALHRRHAPRAYRVAFRMLGVQADAEDAVQEMWLRAVPRLAGFTWRSALSTWLIAITVNVCRETLARRGRWNMVDMDEDVIAIEPADTRQTLDLERAIARLPAACRAAFVLHDIEGFTHEEIGEHFGYTAGTSKSQVFRARRALRRMLGGSDAEVRKNGTR